MIQADIGRDTHAAECIRPQPYGRPKDVRPEAARGEKIFDPVGDVVGGPVVHQYHLIARTHAGSEAVQALPDIGGDIIGRDDEGNAHPNLP
ncbi:hypothetical protein FHS51_001509 [Sphingobium wenxiniae]|nr:hypothetical protein [Sphingobium wenxiniae]